ncbi:MAG: hypothetical protein IKC06_08540 [Clostridia bacterium]|nr:hypothetical protein [Clostridia bacterium]
MKLIKFTSILLCFIMIAAMFAGCDTPEESKADVTESNISDVSEEVSRQENEVLIAIESWGMDEDWDFLKGWPVHRCYFSGVVVQGNYYINYTESFFRVLKSDAHRDSEILFHVGVVAFNILETDLKSPAVNDFKRIKFEFDAWLKAGNIPLEYYDNGVFHGDLSKNDIEKIIEYAEKCGIHLFFDIHQNEECLEGKNIYDCDWCNED